jgi:hypothetical protein
MCNHILYVLDPSIMISYISMRQQNVSNNFPESMTKADSLQKYYAYCLLPRGTELPKMDPFPPSYVRRRSSLLWPMTETRSSY